MTTTKVTPTSEQRTQQLILRGILPTEAEQIVANTDARNGALFTESEAQVFALDDDASRQADKMWPLWTPDIPNRYRRLWTARVIDNA